MSTVWRFTGPPENWITALTIKKWALNEANINIWEKLQPNDVVLFHSTTKSEFVKNPPSSIIGYGYIGNEKKRKDDYLWIQEINEKVNKWPYVVNFKDIFAFSDISKIDLNISLKEKSHEQIKREINELISNAIPIRFLINQAKILNPNVPNFPYNGSASRLNELYGKIVLNQDRQIYQLLTNIEGSKAKERVLEQLVVGQTFKSRRELYDANVHRELIRGICPKSKSIVLSGGYVDDEDYGDTIIYTGEGGRDTKTGLQVSNQSLTGGNLALANNCTQGNPIRVIRGAQLESEYAPETGYRYDGLYSIENYWKQKGRDGYNIFRFKLTRIEGQETLQEVLDEENKGGSSAKGGNYQPRRTEIISSRIIRNTAVGNEVKEIYNYNCQVCGLRIETPSGPYAECCHIKPLGRPHDGPDIIENVLCLCPNHHLMLDKYVIHISNDFRIVETGERINKDDNHNIDVEYIIYHRKLSMD